MFVTKIKALRLSLGMNQIEFGNILNVTKQSVSNWENGNIQPSIDMLIKNAKESAVAIESEDEQFIYEGDKEYNSVKTYSDKLENIDTAKLIDIALNLEKECIRYLRLMILCTLSVQGDFRMQVHLLVQF